MGLVVVGCQTPRTSKGEAPRLKTGAIGVVYAISETQADIEIQIVFPSQAADHFPSAFPPAGTEYWQAKAPIDFLGNLLLFDAEGILTSIKNPRGFHLVFWCENDGGTQYRPEAKLMVSKASLRRPLSASVELKGLSAFALTLPTGQTLAGKSIPSIEPGSTEEGTLMQGRLSLGGRPVAMIRAESGAENCDKNGPEGLMVYLRTAQGEFPLRCCGP